MSRNSLLASVPLTVTHRYGVDRRLPLSGEALQSPGNWDILRTRDPAGSFGFGTSREAWIARAGAHPVLPGLATEVVTLLRGWSARRMVSVGVGTAMLEYLIQARMEELVQRCGDYAPDSLEILRAWFHECHSVEIMDLRQPTWATDPDEVVLLNRVDTELTDAEWRRTFSQLAQRQVKRVIWIPCGLLTRLVATRELRSTVAALVRRRRLARAGYLRTERRMTELFQVGYRLAVVHPSDELPIWALDRLGDQ